MTFEQFMQKRTNNIERRIKSIELYSREDMPHPSSVDGNLI